MAIEVLEYHWKFGDGQDIIKKDLKQTGGMGTSIYHNKLGYMIWRVSRGT